MGRLAAGIVRFCAFAHSSSRFFRGATATVLVLALAFQLCISFKLGGAQFSTAVDDIGTAVVAVLAGVACAIAACWTRQSTRLGWGLLAASALSWAAGEGYWAYVEVGLGQTVPSPSPADVGFLAMVGLAFAGVFVFAVAASRRSEGLRALVDGLLIASSLLLVTWEAILRTTFAGSALPTLGKLVNLSYPVSDIAMFTIAVVVLTRVSRGARVAIGLLSGGLICFAVADTGFVYLTAATHYTGNALDGGWFVGYLLITLSSLRAQDMTAANEGERLGGQARMVAPYAAILLALATAAVVAFRDGQLDTVGVRVGAAIAGLSIISQLLVILENGFLLRQSRANEQALLESRRSLEQVIDNAPVALFSIDTAGVLTLATGNALKGFGERAVHLAGRNVREVLRDSPAFLAAIEGALAGRPGQVIATFEHGDLDVRLLPVFEDGRITAVSGVAIDVTERRLAEQVRRESEAKSRFLANMSHELRTPLNSVLGFAELLLGQRRGDLTPSQQRYVGNIVASGKHLLTLINDVLDLSRVASGEVEVVIRNVTVAEEINAAMVKIRPLADRKRLLLAFDEGEGLEALADPLRLQQIVLNLLSNAIKFTPSGGRVKVATRRTGFMVEIEVTDTGIGIPTAYLERIFDEYSQVDDAYTRDQEGTGLGLAVSRKLAELMSATLSVESELGRGSVFLLRLPAASVVPAENAAGGGKGYHRPDDEPAKIAAEAS
jgi:PAS domain S-box-containing protein